jgi:hypothetical protein
LLSLTVIPHCLPEGLENRWPKSKSKVRLVPPTLPLSALHYEQEVHHVGCCHGEPAVGLRGVVLTGANSRQEQKRRDVSSYNSLYWAVLTAGHRLRSTAKAFSTPPAIPARRQPFLPFPCMLTALCHRRRVRVPVSPARTASAHPDPAQSRYPPQSGQRPSAPIDLGLHAHASSSSTCRTTACPPKTSGAAWASDRGGCLAAMCDLGDASRSQPRLGSTSAPQRHATN